MTRYLRQIRALVLAFLTYVTLSTSIPPQSLQPSISPVIEAPATYIVQATSAPEAARLVHSAGGTVSATLTIINGVSAQLGSDAVARLRANPAVVLHRDADVYATSLQYEAEADTTAQTLANDEDYPLYPAVATGADKLRARDAKLLGTGVTVAVIDSGFMRFRDNIWKQQGDALIANGANGRYIVYKDFATDAQAQVDGAGKPTSADPHGHGTHVISTIADNRKAKFAPGGSYSPVGIAPNVNLVVARVLDANGASTYGKVIEAINWVVQNRNAYNVKVLNLSLYAPINGPYWADPLNQAVMKAWQAGITVVVAAGNSGPQAGSITSPGNIPYVISVGSVKSGRYTPSGADELAFYSSRGPTESAFAKPDVLVRASRTIAPVPESSTLYNAIPEAAQPNMQGEVDFGIGKPDKHHVYFRLSGTSMAAAEVSGIVALVLQQNPGLTNDQVKYRLMATANQAVDSATGEPVYSVWEQGAGLLNVEQAVLTTTITLGAANEGMNLAADLVAIGNEHYWGHTRYLSETGQFVLCATEEATCSEKNILDIWAGGSQAWAGGSQAWAGGSQAWAGGSQAWAGGSQAWAGGSQAWAGGSQAWAGGGPLRLWAGGSQAWAGSTTVDSLDAASYAEVPAADPDQSLQRTYLPLLN